MSDVSTDRLLRDAIRLMRQERDDMCETCAWLTRARKSRKAAA